MKFWVEISCDLTELVWLVMDSISTEEIDVFNKLINDTQIQSLEVLNFVKNIDKNCDDDQMKNTDKVWPIFFAIYD